MSLRMIDQFLEMVQIDSESGNEANFINYLEKEFIVEIELNLPENWEP